VLLYKTVTVQAGCHMTFLHDSNSVREESSSSILYLPSDCRVALTANVSEHFSSTMGKDQTTTPGTSCPALYDEYVGSLTSPAGHNSEDAGEGAYGLSYPRPPVR